MKPKKSVSPAADFLRIGDWRKRLASNAEGAQFVAGLGCLIVSGFSVKARRDAVLASPPKKPLTPNEALELAKILKEIGGWEWDNEEKMFISYFPKG